MLLPAFCEKIKLRCLGIPHGNAYPAMEKVMPDSPLTFAGPKGQQ